MKKLFLICAVSLPMLVLAQQPVQKGERLDDARIIHKTPVPAEVQSVVEEAVGADAITVLEPEFRELEERYQKQLDQIHAQIALAQPEQQEALELQAMALKGQLQEERLQTVLNYVRAQNNVEAEERVLNAIDAFYNKQPVQRVNVVRDPVTGAEVTGGAQ